MDEYSEEIRDIVDRMPTYWCRHMALIMFAVIIVLIMLSFVIKYPDTVDGQISVTGTDAPVRIVTKMSGRLHLLKQQNCSVKIGTPIAYIENGATYTDIIKLKNDLIIDTLLKIRKELNVGELSEYYNNYIIAVEHWERMKSSELYANVRQRLESQIAVNKSVLAQIKKSMDIKSQVLSNYLNEFRRDSALASCELVSQSQLESTQNKYLTQLEEESSLKNSLLAKQSEISISKIEIVRSRIQEDELLEEAYVDMMVKRNILRTQLQLWEDKYMLIAPISGKLGYLGFWRENVAIKSGEELFSLLPSHNQLIGEANIPSNGAGKIRVGQKVNVKLYEHPYDEFGLLEGIVTAISPLTNRIHVNENTMDTYQVLVYFPHGAITNFGYPLELNFESKGTIEIITAQKCLIERLFDNLKAYAIK